MTKQHGLCLAKFEIPFIRIFPPDFLANGFFEGHENIPNSVHKKKKQPRAHFKLFSHDHKFFTDNVHSRTQ